MFEITIWRVVGQVCVVALLVFAYNLYKVRMMVRRVQSEHGIDILPHSFLFGHLLVIDQVMRKAKLPPKAHPHWIPLLFMQEYPELANKGILYFDVWPISQPLLAIWHIDLLNQIQEGNFPKSPLMKMEMGPVTGGHDLLTSEGQEWKQARAMFRPGFSAQNLMSMLPDFMDEINIFKGKLEEFAETGEVVKLEKLAIKMAIDVMGRAVLGVSLNTQTTGSPLVDTILAQLPLLYNQFDPKKLLNPMRYFKLWLYRRRFRKLLLPYIDQAIKAQDASSTKSKTVVKLALKEDSKNESLSSSEYLSDFIERTVGHFWMFLFAGHDTTAISLAFAYYLLSRNPDKAAILRAEHDRVLGPDPSLASERLKSNPALVNQLPYTNGVFKESLRLWAPVTGGVRATPPGHFITHPETNERFPTHGWMVNTAGAVLHRWDKYWHRPNDFIPERWLTTDPKDPFYPKKGSFRAFEMGHRNCIGQELVGMEIRLVLALTVREFEVMDQYEEGGPTFLGEKAYSTEMKENVVTAHTLNQMPVIIKRRS